MGSAPEIHHCTANDSSRIGRYDDPVPGGPPKYSVVKSSETFSGLRIRRLSRTTALSS